VRGHQADWSPKGERIVFLKGVDIHVMDTNSSNSLNFDVKGLHPRWLSDGKKIVYDYEDKIYIIDSDGSNIRKLGEGSWPDESPNGIQIVFVTTTGSIAIMDQSGVITKSLGVRGVSPTWSPDGKNIAFSYGGINIINADGTGLRKLSTHGRTPDWSPDSKKIVFTSFEGISKKGAPGKISILPITSQ